MITVIGMLLAFWSGFLVCKYANKPINEIPVLKTIQEVTETIKEQRIENKLTKEELEDQEKANSFYDG